MHREEKIERRRISKRRVWELVNEARGHNPTGAVNELTERYRYLIIKLVNEALSRGIREDFGELYQRGVVGLLIALNRFNKKYKTQFYTYAYSWIKAAIAGAVSLERDMSKTISRKTVSLDSPVAEDNPTPLSEHLPSQTSPCPFKEAQIAEIWRMVDSLPEREQRVILLRYKKGFTLKETGRYMGGLTRERVRQIEVSAISRLRAIVSQSPHD